MYGKIRRFINVSTDEVYGESSLGSEFGLNGNSLKLAVNRQVSLSPIPSNLWHLALHAFNIIRQPDVRCDLLACCSA